MKTSSKFAVALPAALVMLGACVTYDDYGYGTASVGVGYSNGYPGYGYGYGYGYYPPGYYPYGYSPIYYDAFYDNFYGPIYGGYWHADGFFYYQSAFGGPWYCDYGSHFRRDHFPGGNQYRFEDRRGDGAGDVVNNVRDYVGGGPGQNNGGASSPQGQVAGGQGQSNPPPAPRQRNRGAFGGSISDAIGGGSSYSGGGSPYSGGSSSGGAPASAPSSPSAPSSRGGGVADGIRGALGGGPRADFDLAPQQQSSAPQQQQRMRSDRPSSERRAAPQRQDGGSGWQGQSQGNRGGVHRRGH